MPILSLNFGLSSFTALYLDDKNIQTYWTFDYTYQPKLYSHFYSQDDFYTDAFKLFLKTKQIKSGNTPIVATGYNLPITIGNNIVLNLPLEEIISKIEEYSVVYIDQNKIITQNGIFDNNDDIPSDLSSRERDFMLNSEFYKNIKPTNLSQSEAMLRKIYNMFSNQDILKDITEDKPILFISDIFNNDRHEYLFLSYFYLLSMIYKKGTYKIYVDSYDKLVHLYLISTYNQQYLDQLKSYSLNSLGTLLSYPGDLSCLIKNDISNPQLIDLKSGQLFFMPAEDTANLLVNIKSGQDIIEKKVSGGKIGLIIDTREKDPSFYNQDLLKKDIEMNLKNLEEALSRI